MEDMDIKTISIELEGLSDIMFNKFIDHSKEKRPAEQRLYLTKGKKGNQVVLPAANIRAFLCGEKVAGCAKKFEGKAAASYIDAVMAHVGVKESIIPFHVNGDPIIFKDFEDDHWYVNDWDGGITKSGSQIVKQEATPRPVLRLPWSLSFTLSLVKNDLVNENKLHNWFDRGGVLVALGTYRPFHGRFLVKKWDVS